MADTLVDPFADAEILDPFADAILTPKVERPFTSAEYYEPDLMGDIPTDSRIYQQLMTTPEFRDADANEKKRLYRKAVDDANFETYRQQGEPVELVESLGGEMRTQTIQTEDGQRTYVVPSPGAAGMPGFLRAPAGGVLKAVQETGNLIEGATDYVGLTDSETDYFREEFPTIPPENNLEAVGQEFSSILVGSVSGAGVANKLMKMYDLSPKMAKYIASTWSKVRSTDPAENLQRAEAIAKTFALGTAANIGATVTTPVEAEPLFGDEVVEALGFDAEENRYLTNFADNVTFSAGLTLLGRFVGTSGKLLKKVVPIKGSKKREMELGAMMFQELDPNLADVPAEVFADRARIMGEVMRDNKTFRAALLGDVDIELDTTTALYQGAEDYVRRAYGWQQSFMNPDEFEKFVAETAGSMRSRMTDIRQGRVTSGSQLIREADQKIAKGFTDAMNATSDELGGQVAVEAAADVLSDPVIKNVEDALGEFNAARDALDQAETALELTSNKNAITEILVEANRSNALGSDETQRALLETLTGDQLYRNWSEMRNAYKSAFKSLPDADVDLKELVTLIQDTSRRTNSFDDVTDMGIKSDPLVRLLKLTSPQTARGVTESDKEVVARLEKGGSNFKQLFTDIRPQLELKIRNLKSKQQDASALIALKRGIDAIALNVAPKEYGEAIAKYEEYAETFLATAPLRNFSAVAKEVNPNLKTASGEIKGLADAYQAGMDAMQQAMGGVRAQQDAFLAAMNAGTDNIKDNPEFAEAFVGQAMNMLTRSLEPGQNVNSRQIINAVQPFLRILENVDSKTVQMFQETVSDLSMVEAGLMKAKDAVAQNKKSYSEVLKEAKRKAASKFIENIDSVPVPAGNPQAKFDAIFTSKEAPRVITQLLGEAGGDPLVVEGMQAQYLDWLKRDLQTARRMTAADIAGEVRELSGNKLDQILRNPSSPVLRSLSTLFADNPDRAAQVVALLDVQDLALNGRASRGTTFGSNTAYDQEIKQLVNRAVTLTFGVLNPTATVARNISAAVTSGYADKVQASAFDALDMMIKEPDEFDRVLKLIAEGKEQEASNALASHFGRAYYGTFGEESDRNTDSNIDQEMQILGVK